MLRPRWHDVVIAVGLVAIFTVGALALWGAEVRALLEDERDDRTPPIAPGAL